MKSMYNAKEVAEILGVTERAIRKRANKDNWSYEKKRSRGNRGYQKLFPFSTLPKDIQAKIKVYEAKQLLKSNSTDLNQPDCSLQSIVQKPKNVEKTEIPPWAQEIALARFELVMMFSEKKGLKEKQSLIEAYNTGKLFPKIYKKLGKVSLKTLYRWQKTLNEYGNDFLALAPDWGRAKRGKTKVTDEEAKILLSQLLHQNRLKIAQAIKITKYILKEKGIPSPSSPATLRRFAKSFEKAHYDIWVLAREGEKALIDKVLPHLERDADVLKTGDLLVADGHKCNFQVINPYTGKPTRPTLIAFYDWSSRDVAGYCIMVTENIQAIHLALYRAILRIGRIPTVVYLDNGKAFRAKVFTGIKDFREEGIVGLYARLGIHTIFARPYNAKAKPVERFFSTLDSFERMLPSFVGANIQDKPARLLRNEKFMQYISLNYTPTIKEAEAWFEKWLDFYRSQPSKALNGLCPKDVFRPGPGVDPKELYMLMLCEKEVKLYRNGIKLFGYWFWNEALYGLKEKVIVRYDLHDLRSVLVFTQDGEFLCEAKRLEKVHPAAAIFGDEKSYTEIKKRLSEQRKLKKLTKKLVQMGINASIDWQDVAEKVPEVIEDIDKNRAKAVKAFKAKTDDVLVIDDSEIEKFSLPEPEEKPDRPIFQNETEKYFYLMDLKSKGETLTEEDVEFIKEYEKDPVNKAVVSLVKSQNPTSSHDEAIGS